MIGFATFPSVSHTRKLYNEACKQTRFTEDRLDSLELALGEPLVTRLAAKSLEHGGKRYHTDPKATKGKLQFHSLSLHTMTKSISAPSRTKVVAELRLQEENSSLAEPLHAKYVESQPRTMI